MDGLKKGFSKMLNYKTFLMILLVAIIFIVAAIYTYKQYVTPRTNPSYVANKEYLTEEEDASKVAELYFFIQTGARTAKRPNLSGRALKKKLAQRK